MNIVLDARDVEEYSDMFVACCEEILAVLREQDLTRIKSINTGIILLFS